MGFVKNLVRASKVALVVALLAGIAGLAFSALWGWIGGINQILDAFALEPDDNAAAIWGFVRTFFAGLVLTFISFQLIFSALVGGVFLRVFEKTSQPSTLSLGHPDPDDLFDKFFGTKGW